MRLVVKVGGAQLEEGASRAELAGAVADAVAAGHHVVLVHGGGNQIRALASRLGLAERREQGLRVTDAATAEAVLMVLGGQVNRELVRALGEAGVPAVGLTGADGATFDARPHDASGVDLGYVGEVGDVRPALVEHLLAGGFVPVVGTVAPLASDADAPRDRFYNINADMGAGPLTRAFGADALLLLTDVPGVLDGNGALLPWLTDETCAELRGKGVIAGGMLPKVASALAAARENPGALVKIAPAEGSDCVLAALDDRVGTRFEIRGAREEGRVHG